MMKLKYLIELPHSWMAATISQVVTFPNEQILNNYDKMSVEYLGMS